MTAGSSQRTASCDAWLTPRGGGSGGLSADYLDPVDSCRSRLIVKGSRDIDCLYMSLAMACSTCWSCSPALRSRLHVYAIAGAIRDCSGRDLHIDSSLLYPHGLEKRLS